MSRRQREGRGGKDHHGCGRADCGVCSRGPRHSREAQDRQAVEEAREFERAVLADLLDLTDGKLRED